MVRLRLQLSDIANVNGMGGEERERSGIFEVDERRRKSRVRKIARERDGDEKERNTHNGEENPPLPLPMRLKYPRGEGKDEDGRL